MGDKAKQWYFNTVTEQAELGPLSPISRRMGPYASKEDALNAWKIVNARNRAWDQDDREWHDGRDGNQGSER